MSNPESVTLPALPAALHWRGRPQAWSPDGDDRLSITAGARTDWFIDPAGSIKVLNAPALLMPVQRPCMLQAYIQAASQSTYDAGVLVVYQADDQWAKLCLERSPQQQVMVVSVVTKGTSDDCNSVVLPESAAYFRVSVLERAAAFHYSTDSVFWNLVRYFTLDSAAPLHIGFLAQSPTGERCTASFSQIRFAAEELSDLRSGI